MPVKKNRTTPLVKRKKFARAIVRNGGNITQSYMETVPVKYNTARVNGSLFAKRPDVQRAILEACEEAGVDYRYLLKTRKKFVDAGVSELEKQLDDKSGLYRPKVSSADTSKHLQGMEKTLERVGSDGLTNDSTRGNKHLHLHLNDKTPGEILQKRQELSQFFTDIIDG